MIKHVKKNWPIYAWYFIIIIGLIITIAPFWWALSSSFKDNVTIFAEVSPFSFWSMVPGTSLDPYYGICLLYTSPSPRDGLLSRMPSSA